MVRELLITLLFSATDLKNFPFFEKSMLSEHSFQQFKKGIVETAHRSD